MRVYLCGPMDWCSDDEAKGWREAAASFLNRVGIITLDPMDRPSFSENGPATGKLPDLVEDDKIDIEAADVLLVGYSKVSPGTSMEILLAWQKDKCVIVVCPEDTVLSPWVTYHTHKIFHDMQDAYDYILEMARRMGDR